MPKLKTHKGTSKRIRLTKSGKLLRLLRRNAATHHKLAHQTTRSKRAKKADTKINGSVKQTIRRALGV